jgi:hypothetical protein
MTSVDPTLLRGSEVSHLHPTIFARDHAELASLATTPIARADRVGLFPKVDGAHLSGKSLSHRAILRSREPRSVATGAARRYARRRSTVGEMPCARLVNECDRELVLPIDGLWGRASFVLRLVVQSGTSRQFPLMTVLQSL